MRNSQEIYEAVKRTAKEKSISLNQIIRECGLSKNFFSSWKTKESVPRRENMQLIADCLGVTVDYLMIGENYDSTAIIMKDMPVHMIPLYESVSAGFGACPDNNIIEYVPCFIVNPDEAKETICVKVRGDSMAPKIEDGDIIQVHRRDFVDSGSVAVVLIDGEESVVKRIVYDKTWIELQSLNPIYAPRRFEGRDVLRCRVLGLVKKVIKEM